MNHSRATKECSIAINHDSVKNKACIIPHNLQIIPYLFNRLTLFEKRFPIILKSINKISIKFQIRNTLLLKLLQSNMICFINS